MDIENLLKLFSNSQKDNNHPQEQSIPKEVLNQYPYGEFPIKYTKYGQEQIRKQSENRFSYEEEKPVNQSNTNLDLSSILPLISIFTNKKQPKDMFELLSTFLFKDKPELKNLFGNIAKPKNQEITPDEFPDTNKISISSLKRIN